MSKKESAILISSTCPTELKMCMKKVHTDVQSNIIPNGQRTTSNVHQLREKNLIDAVHAK